MPIITMAENSQPPPYFQNPDADSSPFFYEGGPVGVLLIHGYTATPIEVSLLGKYLHVRGYTVSGPRLPGHGTSIEDLHFCRWQDWAVHVDNAYSVLRSCCNRVFVGGVSLGSLLTLYLGAQHREIAGLIVCSPALRARNWLINLTPLVHPFVKAIKKRRSATIKASVAHERWQGYTVDSVPALAQVLSLQRHVSQLLPAITQPIVIFIGRLDQTIDVQAARGLYDRVASADKEVVWMEKSTHSIFLDLEWDAVARKTNSFIERRMRQ